MHRPTPLRRWLTVALCPPWAIADCGCALGCAPPIAVLYLAGLFALVLGTAFGGPTGRPGVCWQTIAIGGALWAGAALWGGVVLARLDGRCDLVEDGREGPRGP